MLRHVLLGAGLALALTACASSSSSGSAVVAAEGPSPELERLSNLIGSWTGTTRVLAAPEGMLPPAAVEAGQEDAGLAAAWEARWVLGGKFLQQAGWHDVGAEEKSHYVEYVRWDEDAGKFRTWYFSDRGEVGQGSWIVSNDGRTITVSAQGRKADGSAFSGRGRMEFAADGTMSWTWQENGAQGRLELEGSGAPAG